MKLRQLLVAAEASAEACVANRSAGLAIHIIGQGTVKHMVCKESRCGSPPCSLLRPCNDAGALGLTVIGSDGVQRNFKGIDRSDLLVHRLAGERVRGD